MRFVAIRVNVDGTDVLSEAVFEFQRADLFGEFPGCCAAGPQSAKGERANSPYAVTRSASGEAAHVDLRLAEAREVRSNHPSRVTMESTNMSRSASGRARVSPAPSFGGVCVVVSACEDDLQRAIASDGANRTHGTAELLAWLRILLRSSVIANCKAGFRPSSRANVGSGTPLSPIAFPPGRSARKNFSRFSPPRPSATRAYPDRSSSTDWVRWSMTTSVPSSRTTSAMELPAVVATWRRGAWRFPFLAAKAASLPHQYPGRYKELRTCDPSHAQTVLDPIKYQRGGITVKN